MTRFLLLALIGFSIGFSVNAKAVLLDDHEHSDLHLDDLELYIDGLQKVNCTKANRDQIRVVNSGNKLAQDFLQACYKATNQSPYCLELMRPNPASQKTFECTYGEDQIHQLIHPDADTWEYAFKAVWLIQQLEKKQIKVCSIYNWWRPEPYNANVGGAAGRHPFGTSVDVNFCTKEDQERAHTELCELRSKGHLRALGHYPSNGLHFGVGDRNPNTWGKACN